MFFKTEFNMQQNTVLLMVFLYIAILKATLKVNLLQANYFKLGSILAEMEQKPKPTEPWNNCILKWKEKVISET